MIIKILATLERDHEHELPESISNGESKKFCDDSTTNICL